MNLLRLIFGIFVALALGVAPVVLFCMLPAAGLFLILAPFAILALLTAIFLFFLVRGQRSEAAGVALTAFALIALGYAKIVKPFRDLTASCSTGYTALRAASNPQPSTVIFDDVPERDYDGYERRQMVAVIKRADVIELTRSAQGNVTAATIMRAEPPESCAGALKRRKISVNGVMPVILNVCLRRTATTRSAGDVKPALVFRGHAATETNGCHAIDIIERAEGGETFLGRVKFLTRDGVAHPQLRRPGEVGNERALWFLWMMRAVMGDDMSNDVLKRRHAVAECTYDGCKGDCSPKICPPDNCDMGPD